MIPALGAGGPGFESRIAPSFFYCRVSINPYYSKFINDSNASNNFTGHHSLLAFRYGINGRSHISRAH